MAKPNWKEVTETDLEHIAKIIGPQSAAALAMRELALRRGNGEDAHCYSDGCALFVGPKLPEQQ